MYRTIPKTMNLYGVFKFIVGFFLAILILAGATVATALYFAARLSELPERPTFPNDNPQTKIAAKPVTPQAAVTPTPIPTPEAEKLEKFDIYSERVQKINEYLQIPTPYIKDYADLYIDQNKLDDHFNWRKFAHNSDTDAAQDLKDNMIQIDEFNVQKHIQNITKFCIYTNSEKRSA